MTAKKETSKVSELKTSKSQVEKRKARLSEGEGLQVGRSAENDDRVSLGDADRRESSAMATDKNVLAVDEAKSRAQSHSRYSAKELLETESHLSKTVAVVSGKGGSGKTMVATSIAKVLDSAGVSTTLVDTDVGTGGLSYYLAVKHISGGINVGISEMLMRKSGEHQDEHSKQIETKGLIQKIDGFSDSYFVAVGDHRRLLRERKEDHFRDEIGGALEYLRNRMGNFLICDCRGGIDEDSLAVCEFADFIILVIETDAASFQTTIHLVDVLSDNGLSYKIKGFLINKVFDNPSTIVTNGQGAFRAQYLSAIPYDLDALRGFLVGDTPSLNSVFSDHVRSGIRKLFPEYLGSDRDRVWEFEDYSTVALSDVDARTGGVALSAFLMLIFMYIPISYYIFGHADWVSPQHGEYNWPSMLDYLVVASGLFAGFLGCVGVTRRIVGRVVNLYVKALGMLIGKSF